MTRANYDNEAFSNKISTWIGPELLSSVDTIQEELYKNRSVQLRKYIIAGVEADQKELNL